MNTHRHRTPYQAPTNHTTPQKVWPGGGDTEQFIGAFSPETSVRPRFRLDIKGNNIRVTIRIVSAGGTTFYLDSGFQWTTTVSEILFSSSVVTTITFAPLVGEDFPIAGDLFIKVRNNGANAQWGDIDMFLIDDAGALIDDWTFTIGTSQGARITLSAVPSLEAGPGPVFVPAELQSELTGITFDGVNFYLVSDRLAQDTPGLDNLRGGLFAVAGPEAVVRATNDLGVISDYIGNGGDIDLVRGVTDGVWLALDDLSGVIGSGS